MYSSSLVIKILLTKLFTPVQSNLLQGSFYHSAFRFFPLEICRQFQHFQQCCLTVAALCERAVNDCIEGEQDGMESAGASISAMFCMTIRSKINKNNFFFFLPPKSAHVPEYPLGNQIHHSTQAHCIAKFSLSTQNGAYVVYRPCEFMCGFHQGRVSLSQKMPFCIVNFQSCTIFWH